MNILEEQASSGGEGQEHPLSGEERIELRITLPSDATRAQVLALIRQQLGEGEQTAILIDQIEQMWDSIDLVRSILGDQHTHQLIFAETMLPARINYREA